MVDLGTVIKSGYDDKKSQEILKHMGYNYDSMLSNRNEQVWINPKERKLIYNVSGTHNISDIGTDIWLASGNLKSTNRYREADKTLQQAKNKYKDASVTLTGHSLGHSIISGIKKDGDQLYGYNGGYTVGQKTRSNNGESHHYRTSGDLVSVLSGNAKNIKTLQNQNHKSGSFIINALNAHNSSNLETSKIII